jgi:hypothetical protein
LDKVRVVEEKKQYGLDGSIAIITKFDCGCVIVRTANYLFMVIDEPMWIRCPRHRNAKPEEIIVEK